MLALENPHCGISGVPFMKSTTGAVDTALSSIDFVSTDNKRSCCIEGCGGCNLGTAAMRCLEGLATCRKACGR